MIEFVEEEVREALTPAVVTRMVGPPSAGAVVFRQLNEGPDWKAVWENLDSISGSVPSLRRSAADAVLDQSSRRIRMAQGGVYPAVAAEVTGLHFIPSQPFPFTFPSPTEKLKL